MNRALFLLFCMVASAGPGGCALIDNEVKLGFTAPEPAGTLARGSVGVPPPTGA